MPEKYLTVKQAADVAGKSASTITRACKAKNIRSKKQGKRVMVNADSLRKHYGIEQKTAMQLPAVRVNTLPVPADKSYIAKLHSEINARDLLLISAGEKIRELEGKLETKQMQTSPTKKLWQNPLFVRSLFAPHLNDSGVASGAKEQVLCNAK